jgi:hypothetical protein
MRTRALLLVLLAAVLGAAPAAAGDVVLNGRGASGPYRVFRVDGEGAFTNPTSIISPAGGFDAASVYWPSAVRVGDDVLVYATAQDGSGNLTLGLWVSEDGGAFARVGQVLTPIAGEGQIGSAHVIFDPADEAAPFKMWFGTNYGPRATVIKYATSEDGLAWTRQASVIEASEGYESEGFQLDTVCYDATAETWRMFYAASDDAANVFRAIEATADAPDGPWTKRGVVFAPGGSAHAVLSTVTPGSRYLLLDGAEGLAPGGVYVLSNGTASERVVIETVLDDDEASIRDAMVSSGTGFGLRSAHYRKAGVSTYWRDAQGQGRALLTGWGAFTSGLQEYVFEGGETEEGFAVDLAAPARWKPTGPGSLYSFENPSPITSGPECAAP